MKIVKKIILLGIMILLIVTTNTSYARLVDIEYPPNSTGYTDFTDEEADSQAEEQTNESNTSEDYVGKSSNNNLKSLQIENAIIEPEFNAWILDYTVTLNDQHTRTINIVAEAEDETATVEGAGTIELSDGINNLQLIVRAENGNVKIYNLTINLPYIQSDLRLNSLEISGIHIDGGEDSEEKISPTFDRDIFEYTLTVPYEINGLNIKTDSEEGTYVSISGQDPLDVGNNTVIIEVNDSNDENNKTTYVIEVERETEKNINKLIIIIIILVVIFIIISLILKNKRHTDNYSRRKKEAKH